MGCPGTRGEPPGAAGHAGPAARGQPVPSAALSPGKEALGAAPAVLHSLGRLEKTLVSAVERVGSAK